MTSPQLSRLDPYELQSRGVMPFIVTHLRALLAAELIFENTNLVLILTMFFIHKESGSLLVTKLDGQSRGGQLIPAAVLKLMSGYFYLSYFSFVCLFVCLFVLLLVVVSAVIAASTSQNL